MSELAVVSIVVSLAVMLSQVMAVESAELAIISITISLAVITSQFLGIEAADRPRIYFQK